MTRGGQGVLTAAMENIASARRVLVAGTSG